MYVCPRSSDPFYIVSYFIKWVTTSWTDSSEHVTGHTFTGGRFIICCSAPDLDNYRMPQKYPQINIHSRWHFQGTVWPWYLVQFHSLLTTVCPKRLDPFSIRYYKNGTRHLGHKYIKMDTTSWTYGTSRMNVFLESQPQHVAFIIVDILH